MKLPAPMNRPRALSISIRQLLPLYRTTAAVNPQLSENWKPAHKLSHTAVQVESVQTEYTTRFRMRCRSKRAVLIAPTLSINREQGYGDQTQFF